MAAGVCAIVVATALIPAAGSARKPLPGERIVLKAIATQASRGHITPAEASRYSAAVRRTVTLIRVLPPSRRVPLASQLAQAAAIAPRLTAPRALAVFGQLAVNDDWFARHGPPSLHTDVTDADGVVYRYFTVKGFEFHPLANFAALNAAVAAKEVAAAGRLATALADRGVPAAGGGVGWEYYFNYAGGNAPWLSGFAQAVAAQAFARVAALVPGSSSRYMAEARSAYRSIPGRLDRATAFGTWIRLYGFSRAVVLNAQLQSAISLAGYAKAASDGQAAALASSLKDAAARALPSFSTGYWSYYQLPDEPSPQSYQEYVVQLLQTLAIGDPRFSGAATAFSGFETRPPAFRLAGSAPGAVSFWVSKPATVLVDALGDARRLSVSGGWHTVSWTLPSRPGIFPVTIHATDWAGNGASVHALPIVRVASPPKKKKHRPARKTTSVAATLPALTIGAGLDQPTQAPLAAQAGLGAVRMTLLWPAGASSPDPGVLAALGRLPAGTDLLLDLYVSALPTDDTGRAALAAYAAAVAQGVPSLRDLVLGPAPASTTAAAYEAALAAVFDGVKAVATSVRVDGDLDGSQAPKATLTALAAAFRSSARSIQLMDELAFTPAPAAGKSLWALGDLSKLVAALETGFGGTAQPGASLPLIVDDVAVESAIPAAELPLYSSPAVGTTGDDEEAQAAAYVSVLRTVACRATVVGVLLDRLLDGTAPGQQSGLYYPDGSPKTSLAAVTAAAAAAQSVTRGCGSAPRPAPAPTPTTTTTTTPATPASPTPTVPKGTTGPTGDKTPAVPTPAAPTPAVPVASAEALAFPDGISVSTPPRVHVGCISACLYLVTMQKASNGTPVLARRGVLAKAGTRTVTLPKAPVAKGTYRFSVWIVAASNPGPVSVARSGVVVAD